MTDVAAPRSTRPYAVPLLITLLAALACGLIWYWPSDWEAVYRVMAIEGAVLITVLLLGAWLVFLAPLPRWVRLVPVLALVALVLTAPLTVREVSFDGDLVPTFRFVWSPTPDDLLEAHRRQQRGSAVAAEFGPSPAAFAGYLGPYRNGRVDTLSLEPDWTTHPPRELWRQPAGGGYSGFAIALGCAVTLEQRRDEEAVVCYDLASGVELWQHRYPAHFQEKMGGPGPRATPTICRTDGSPAHQRDEARVYTVGALGHLFCLDFATGKPQWSANMLTDHGNENLPWAMAGSPLVADGQVIVTPGVQAPAAKGHGVIAYDAVTGKVAWSIGASRGAYSSPMIADLCGRRQLLVLDGDGLHAYDPKNGAELWFHAWETYAPQYINVAQPLVLDGDRVFITSGYGKGCAMLQVKPSDGRLGAEVLWQNLLLRCKFSSPVHHQGSLYGLDEGILTCLDAKTGKRHWKGGRYGHGQVLLVDGHLLLTAENGDLVLVEATPEAPREKGKVAAVRGKTWNPPAVAGRRVLVRNDREMVCYELAGEERAAHAPRGP